MGLTITDDIFDSYGLLDELKIYAEAVERWDKKCINQLPDYMKLAYEKLLEAFDECEQELPKEGRSHIVSYVRELMKRTCRGYLQEAIWANNEGYIPTYDEYMEGAAIATGAHDFLSAVAFMGMGNLVTEQLFEWVSNNPKPVKAASIIGRLLNDIAGHKVGQRRKGDAASAVECYMVQYDMSEEKAREEVYKKIEEAWMDFNEEMLRPTKIPRPLMTVILNLIRSLECSYRLGDDEFSVVNQNMFNKIQTLLIHPIVV